MGNIFRKNTRSLSQSYQNTKDKDMTPQQKKALFNQTKMYIFLQETLKSLEQEHLNKDEVICSVLPLTTDGANFSSMNTGFMGLYHPKSEKAKKYVRDFHDLRGNRLFIFTNQRIIFMTIIEYIDQGLFYSYPYEKIIAITLKKNTLTYFDWSKGFPASRKKMYSYFIDFECENSLFTELLSEADVTLILKQLKEIDKAKSITISEQVYRQRAFDAVLNNPLLGYKATKLLSFGLIFLFLFFLIGMFFGFGPFVLH